MGTGQLTSTCSGASPGWAQVDAPAHCPSPSQSIAVGVIICQGDRIVLIQRAKEPSKGLWTFPGGAIEHESGIETSKLAEIEALAARLDGDAERLVAALERFELRDDTLILQGEPEAIVRLRDVADVELGAEDYVVTFQSRVGRQEWLRPYTDETVEELGKAGLARLDVVCPGFAADCLETLEEIAMQNAEIFAEAGGGELHYIPALNARDDHVVLGVDHPIAVLIRLIGIGNVRAVIACVTNSIWIGAAVRIDIAIFLIRIINKHAVIIAAVQHQMCRRIVSILPACRLSQSPETPSTLSTPLDY